MPGFDETPNRLNPWVGLALTPLGALDYGSVALQLAEVRCERN